MPAARNAASCRVSTCGSASVPQTKPTTARWRPRWRAIAFARTMAGASSAAGSACAPQPMTTSSSTTRTAGSAASDNSRSMREDWSIIGCGRPTVKASSPRSSAVCSRLPWCAFGSDRASFNATLDHTFKPARAHSTCASAV